LDSSIDTRRTRACVRLDALLRELVAVPDFAALDRRAFVEAAALVLSELVDQGQLPDETADRLWLELAGRAQSQHWVSRSAAAACIA
jgi:hypothetical protein